MRRIAILLASLTVLTLAVYWPVHRYDFLSVDDTSYVTRNPFVQNGLNAAGLRYAFTTFTMGNWNPLLWLSFFLDRALLKLQPGAMHMENVLLHLLTGILIWRLLVLATGNLYRSWLVAALFLVHPMHVESVAWISERKDVLSTPFLIGAMICYVRFTKAGPPALGVSALPPSSCAKISRWGFYFAMLVLFALSLMVKTMGVTLPAVLLLLDFWPLRKWPQTSWFKLTIEKIPLILITVSAAIVGNIAQYQSGTIPTLSDLGLVDRISNAGVCYLLYAGKLIVPHHLAFFYGHQNRPAGAALASFAMLALIAYLFARVRRRQPYLIVGWLWFLGTLVPVIGLVQIGRQAMADRYSYFPSIGLLMLIVWGAGDWINRAKIKAAIACACLAIFAIVASRQLTYWTDAEALFTHALEVGEDNSVAHAAVAQLAYNRHDIREAVEESAAALKLAPEGRAYYVLGNCLLGTDPQRAAGYFQQAIDTAPATVEFHVSLAMAYRLTNNLEKAGTEAKTALKLNPYDPSAQEEMKKIEALSNQ